MEEEDIATPSSLSRALQEARDEVQDLKAELQKAKKQQEAFMACMSHELRTPLNAILGLSEALSERIYGDLNTAQEETVKGIEEGGRNLLALINNILDLARLGAGDIQLEKGPISVHDMCVSAIDTFQSKAKDESIELQCSCDDEVDVISGDEVRLRQILHHLIDNAIKFTPAGGTVSLDAVSDPGTNVIHIAVCDTGVGIAKDQIPLLFNSFHQLDSSIRREHSGTGLGLSLVSQLVELHGGSVSVESEPGEGSRFIVTLPVGTIDESAYPQSESGCVDAIVIRRALVVEDSTAAADQMCRYLAERNIETSVCHRGDEALSFALKTNPDIIILDIQLPGLFGWEVMERLKANPATKHIPVMIVSIVDERQRAKSLGASEYLVKPINRNQLSYALCKLMAVCEPESKQEKQKPIASFEAEDERPHILLAEDNEANIKTLTDYLNAKGYHVSIARDGREAVEAAVAQSPDIILMDIQMPNMNGIEAMEELKGRADFEPIPTIAITALAMPGDRERCLEAGACDYLSKPVSLKALNAVIEKLLKVSAEEAVSA